MEFVVYLCPLITLTQKGIPRIQFREVNTQNVKRKFFNIQTQRPRILPIKRCLRKVSSILVLSVVCSARSCQEVAATITVHQLHHSKLYRSLEYGNLNFTHLFPNRQVSGSSKLILSNRYLILQAFISYQLHLNYLRFIVLFTISSSLKN